MGGHMMAMRPGDDRLKSHLELYMNVDHEYCVKNWVEYIKKRHMMNRQRFRHLTIYRELTSKLGVVPRIIVFYFFPPRA